MRRGPSIGAGPRLLAAAVLAGVGACAEARFTTAPASDGPAYARVGIVAVVAVAQAQALHVTFGYARAGAAAVIPLDSQTVVLGAQPDTVAPFRVNITPCVTDAAREPPPDGTAVVAGAPACVLRLGFTLRDGTGASVAAAQRSGTVHPGDQVTAPPVVLAAGASDRRGSAP